MQEQETTQQEMDIPAVFVEENGETLTDLVSPPEAGVLIKGDILKKNTGGKKFRFYEISEIKDQDDSRVAVCKPITPRFMNSVFVTVGLIGGWFAVQYLLSLVGIGG